MLCSVNFAVPGTVALLVIIFIVTLCCEGVCYVREILLTVLFTELTYCIIDWQTLLFGRCLQFHRLKISQ